MLDHARWDPQRERLGGRVEVGHNCVYVPPAHETDHVSVDTLHKEVHGLVVYNWEIDNIFRCEPTWGAIVLVLAHSDSVISVRQTMDHHFPLKTVARCVFLGMMCCRRCSTWHWMAVTAHARVWLVAPFPMESPLMSFFCVVNTMTTMDAAEQVIWESMMDGLGWVPTEKWVSCRVKEVEKVLVLPAKYSPGCRRRNIAIQWMLVISWSRGGGGDLGDRVHAV